MVRGENICSGTTTTSTGTLTLAACPSGVGGIDHDVFLKAKGFVSGGAISTSYTVIEYTDGTFATPSKVEKGVGVVTLGAAIANATLARTTVQETITGGAYSDQAPSAISIGTAANVLVFIGASAADLLASNPYFETSLGDNLGIAPLNVGTSSFGTTIQLGLDGTGSDWYCRILVSKPIYARRAYLRVTTQYSGGGTPLSTAYGRLYYVNSSGRPGKLAVDFGTFGTNPLNSLGTISTSLLTPGQFLTPGEYFFNLFATFTGASGPTNPILSSLTPTLPISMSAGTGKATSFATGGSSTAADPANTTSYALSANNNMLAVTLHNA